MNRRSARFPRRPRSALRIVARDGRIPRPLRLLAAVGIAPIPGRGDELVLVLVAPVVWLRYRPVLEEAWRSTEEKA